MSETRIRLIDRPGVVCVISGERTFPAFSDCLHHMILPPGTIVDWRTASAGTLALATFVSEADTSPTQS